MSVCSHIRVNIRTNTPPTPQLLAIEKIWGATVLSGNSPRKDTLFLRIAKRVEYELATILTLAGTIGLALTGTFKADESFVKCLQKPDGLIFSSSTALVIFGTVAFRKEKDNFSLLQTRVNQAEQDLSVYTETQKKIIPDELETLFQYLQLQRSERISLFSVGTEVRHFSLLARYALDTNYQDPGRKVYPVNQGIVGRVCRGEDYSLDKLPDPKRDLDRYYAAIENTLNVPREVAEKVVMQSRSYAGFGIKDFENRLVAVLVFESENPNGLDSRKLEKVMKEVEHDRLKKLLARTTLDIEPSIPSQEGY